jgi:hypothetical protein
MFPPNIGGIDAPHEPRRMNAAADQAAVNSMPGFNSGRVAGSVRGRTDLVFGTAGRQKLDRGADPLATGAFDLGGQFGRYSRYSHFPALS